jgi:hypothetical protein
VLGDAENLPDGRGLVLRLRAEAEMVEDTSERQGLVTKATMLMR